MSEINTLIERSQQAYAEAKAILLNQQASAEDLERADKLRADGKAFAARASALKEVEMEADLLAKGAQQAKLDQPGAEFKDWPEMVNAVKRYRKSKGRTIDRRLKTFEDADDSIETEGKVMTGRTGAAGGFLIQTEQLTNLMAVAAPLSIIRPRATIIRTSTRTTQVPVLDQTGAVAGQPAWFGGVIAYWTEEAGAATEANQKFRHVNMTVRELVGYCLVGNSLLDDSGPALADILGGPLGFPGAIAWQEDYAFLRGSGVGQPRGIVNSNAFHAVTRTTPSEIKYDDLVNIEAAFMGTQGIWVATQAAKAKLMLMNGPSGNTAYLWGSARDGVPNTLLGDPIFFTDKLPGVGAKGDIMKIDARYYIIIDRQAVTVEDSGDEKFSQNQTAFRVVTRVEGAPWLSAPITLSDGSTKVSPFVGIAA